METKQAISKEINMPVKEIKVNGTNLAYIEQGAGEPVIFIHGAVSDFRTWIEQIGAFSKRYRAISYSRRYHQPNDNGGDRSDYSRNLHAADLVGFIKALDLGKAHLIGHSYGASIALMAAMDYPELVGSLILGEPSPFPSLLNKDGISLLSEQKAKFDEAIRLAESGDEESAVREFLHTVVGVDVLGLLPDERRSVVLENADTLLPMLRTYYESPPLSREQLKRLTVPTLLITGEFSPRISRLSNEMINRCLPNSRTLVLQGASHGLQIENPEGFNRLALDFLSANTNSNRSPKKRQSYEPVLF
jgi:pimeloyl-ACP methyl ester carboxylesterase